MRHLHRVAKHVLNFLVLFPLLGQGQVVLTNPSPCGLNLPIEDQNCPENGNYFSPNRFFINVSNAPGTTLGQDVYLKSVSLIIEHSWTGDLDVVLISPSGKEVTLTSDNGGGNDNYGIFQNNDCGQPTIFELGACTPIQTGEPPFVGQSFKPEESFYAFNDNETNPNGNWILQICDDVDTDAGTLQFVALSFEAISCLPVIDLELVDIDTTSATLDWFPAFDCGTSIIEVGAPGFIPGTDNAPGEGIIFTGICPPITIGGLQEETAYEVYVRKRCPSGAFSPNGCPVSFSTGCLPPGQTIVENFDDQNTCIPLCQSPCSLDANSTWQNSLIDDTDWTVYQDPTPTLGTGPTSDVNGDGNFIYLEASTNNCQGEKVAILTSNCIEINKMGTDTCHLSFNYHMEGQDVGSLALQATTDGGLNWVNIWQLTGDQGKKWQKTYLSLAQFSNGTTVQFRFVGVTGNGPKGDIALDNIVFFGSVDLGIPPFQYFADADGDGYGVDSIFIRTCLPNAPENFVGIGGDCNDQNENIHPDSPEVPCNGIDENCNGDTTDDDSGLPSPSVTNDTICSGETSIICAEPNAGGLIFWYGSADGFDFLDLGNCLEPNLPLNQTASPITYKFYALERLPTCGSAVRAEATVVVNPTPILQVENIPELCPGNSLNLEGLSISDQQFTGAKLTFHDALPTSTENQLVSTVINFDQTTTFYAKGTTNAGCSDQITIPITVKPGPDISFSPSDSISLCKESKVTVSIQASGGSGGYTYLWNNGANNTTRTFSSGFFPGSTDLYPITVTESSGCFTVDTLKIVTTTSIDSLRRNIEDVSDCAGSDGQIQVEPLNGTPPFQFDWSSSNGTTGSLNNVVDQLTIDGLRQGAYRMTITDSSPQQCELTLRSIFVNGPDAEIQEPNIQDISCPGAADGSISIQATGNNIEYLWNTGATTASISDLSPGNYSVTITEGTCQTILENLVLEDPQPLAMSPNVTLPSCVDASDGKINLKTLGGKQPFDFQWSTGDRTELIEGLSAGTFLVTITDMVGCVLVDSVRLEAPLPLAINAMEERRVSCPGLEDGSILVTAGGGTPPYNYQWSNGRTTPFNDGLVAGEYTLSITDQNACTIVEAFTVLPPTPLTHNIIQLQQPECLGDETGAIEIEGIGGNPPYSYQWSDGQQGATRNNLPVGQYEVSIIDSRGCMTETIKIQLDAISTLSFNTNITNPTCFGLSNGSVQLTTNGIEPINYSWSNGANTSLLPNIAAGSYGVTVEDAQGCVLDTMVEVTAPQVFDVGLSVFQPNCANSDDGVINVNLLKSGQPPLTFEWNNGVSTQSLVGISDGFYQLTITDGMGCTYLSDTVMIENPTPLSLEVSAFGEIACFGDSTGFIESIISGGIPPYRINWPKLNTTSTNVYNLPAGNYRLVIQDDQDCPLDTTFQFTQPGPLNTLAKVDVSGICDDATVNRLIGSAAGGVTPYAYLWNNGQTTPILERPQTGDYTLIVSDANNCVDTLSSIKLKRRVTPLTLDSFLINPPTCNGENNATITAAVSGGSNNYRFHFSNSYIVDTSGISLTTPPIEINRDYRVTVTDLGTGCVVVSDLKTATEPPLLKIVRDSINLVECTEEPSGAIYISGIGGTPPFQYIWKNEAGEVIDSVRNLENVIAGTYQVEVTDRNGCTATLNDLKIGISNDAIVIVDSLTSISHVSCFDGENGAINLTISGGKPPFQYSWNTGQTTKDINKISAGTYQLTVVDDNNCQIALPAIDIEQPAAPIRNASVIQNVRCAGDANGALTVSVIGGSPPYNFNWRYEETILADIKENALDSLIAGTYFLLVRDTNQCAILDSFEVREPSPLELSFDITEPGMPGELTQMGVIAKGGEQPYQYLWNTGAQSPQIGLVPAGEYRVTVTDDNDCQAVISTLLVKSMDDTIIESIKVFPNPTSTMLNISLRLKSSNNLDLSILMQDGREIKRERYLQFASGQIQIPVDNLPTGMYILKIRTHARGIYQQAFVVSN